MTSMENASCKKCLSMHLVVYHLIFPLLLHLFHIHFSSLFLPCFERQGTKYQVLLRGWIWMVIKSYLTDYTTATGRPTVGRNILRKVRSSLKKSRNPDGLRMRLADLWACVKSIAKTPAHTNFS